MESKMSHELAALADLAAIEYGVTNGQSVCREEVDYDNSADLTDAFTTGQSWMWAAINHELSSLRHQLTEARHVADVYKEWHKQANDQVANMEDSMRISGALVKEQAARILELSKYKR
jgi:hypothetical protein